MRLKDKIGKLCLPSWLFLPLLVAYNELILHMWVTQTFQVGRLLAVLAFAMGFGCVLGLLTALLPSERASKWVAVGMAAVVAVVCLMEYFLLDAYKTFMPPITIISGAGGVAGEYLDIVLSLLGRNLWRVGLMLLPILLYALFCHSGKSGWKLRGPLPCCICWGSAR